MSDAKHTPGPWTATECGWTVDGPEYRVANIIAVSRDSELRHAANARLIAESPTLLSFARSYRENLLRLGSLLATAAFEKERHTLHELEACLARVEDRAR